MFGNKVFVSISGSPCYFSLGILHDTVYVYDSRNTFLQNLGTFIIAQSHVLTEEKENLSRFEEKIWPKSKNEKSYLGRSSNEFKLKRSK
jgi:hypothetical protein